MSVIKVHVAQTENENVFFHRSNFTLNNCPLNLRIDTFQVYLIKYLLIYIKYDNSTLKSTNVINFRDDRF